MCSVRTLKETSNSNAIFELHLPKNGIEFFAKKKKKKGMIELRKRLHFLNVWVILALVLLYSCTTVK